MRRWGLAACGKCGAGALPPAGEAVLWRPPPAGRACGSFSSPTPPAVGRFPGDPRWLEEHAKVFLPPHSPNCRAEDSSESVPPGTPKLFAFHSSLFSFSARSQARAKNEGIPTQFSGDARKLLPARAILSHLYAVCRHPESGLLGLNPFGTVFNPNGTIHCSPVDFRPSLT